MFRRRPLAAIVVICLIVSLASVARAADDLLDVMPEDVLGFALVNGLADTDAKIQALAQKLQVPAPSLLILFTAMAGLQEGLDEEGTAAIAIMAAEDPGAPPDGVLFLPATDTRKLIGQFGADDASAEITKIQVGTETLLAAGRGGYAVVTKPSHRAALETVLGSSKRLGGSLEGWTEWLAASDVAVVVTRHGIELLTSKGRQAIQQFTDAFASVGDVPTQETQTMVTVLSLYGKVLELIGKETAGYALTIRIDDDGNLRLSERAKIRGEGRIADVLAEIKPPDRNLLAGLPAGPFVFAAGGVFPEGLSEKIMELSADLMKAVPDLYGLDETQTDELVEIYAESMARVRGMSMMIRAAEPGDSVYSGFAAVQFVDDSEAFLAEYGENLKTMNRLFEQAESPLLTPIEVKQIDIDGLPALEMKGETPMLEEMADVPDMSRMMDVLLGPDGKWTAYMVAANERAVVITYSRDEILRAALAAVKAPGSGLAGEPGPAATAAMLPAGAQWIGYVSPKGTIDFARRMIPVVAPPGVALPKLPEFAETPPIGFTVKTTADGLRGDMAVPAAVLKAIGDFAAAARSAN